MPKFVNKPQMMNQSVKGIMMHKEDESKKLFLNDCRRLRKEEEIGSHCIKCLQEEKGAVVYDTEYKYGISDLTKALESITIYNRFK